MAIGAPILMLLANSAGWIFTEMGRQPWVVFGLMTTANGVSPGVSSTEAWISLLSLTLLYGVLAVVEVGLILRFSSGARTRSRSHRTRRCGGTDDEDRPLAFAY